MALHAINIDISRSWLQNALVEHEQLHFGKRIRGNPWAPQTVVVVVVVVETRTFKMLQGFTKLQDATRWKQTCFPLNLCYYVLLFCGIAYFSVIIVVLYVLHSSKLVRNKTRLSCLMAIRPTSTYYLLYIYIYINLLYAAQEERPNVYPTDFDFLTPGFWWTDHVSDVWCFFCSSIFITALHHFGTPFASPRLFIVILL